MVAQHVRKDTKAKGRNWTVASTELLILAHMSLSGWSSTLALSWHNTRALQTSAVAEGVPRTFLTPGLGSGPLTR